MSTMQATATQIDIVGHHVPVTPTEESQADKGIDHSLWSCWECDTVWRSHELTRCPRCARHVGQHLVLDEMQAWELVEAVSYLDETLTFYNEQQWEHEAWKFRNLLCEHASWYNMNSRQTIQACYEELCKRAQHPKVALAVAFLKEDFTFCPEEDNTFCPEDPGFTVDAQYDLQKPSW